MISTSVEAGCKGKFDYFQLRDSMENFAEEAAFTAEASSFVSI